MSVCKSVCDFVTYEDTNRYYKEKVISEDISSFLSIFQKAYKSYRMSFFEKVKMHKVSCKGLV